MLWMLVRIAILLVKWGLIRTRCVAVIVSGASAAMAKWILASVVTLLMVSIVSRGVSASLIVEMAGLMLVRSVTPHRARAQQITVLTEYAARAVIVRSLVVEIISSSLEAMKSAILREVFARVVVSAWVIVYVPNVVMVFAALS
jgi:hypothetical protein